MNHLRHTLLRILLGNTLTLVCTGDKAGLYDTRKNIQLTRWRMAPLNNRDIKLIWR